MTDPVTPVPPVGRPVRLFEVRFKAGEPMIDSVVLEEEDTIDFTDPHRITLMVGDEQLVYMRDSIASYRLKAVMLEPPPEWQSGT